MHMLFGNGGTGGVFRSFFSNALSILSEFVEGPLLTEQPEHSNETADAVLDRAEMDRAFGPASEHVGIFAAATK